jgi:hypothetical protein
MSQRNNYLKRKYGISDGIFQQMLDAQGGLCAICHKSPKRGVNLCIDHDHKSKKMKIRGLLCTKCNYKLGIMHDDLDFMREATIYLEEAQHDNNRNT